MSKELNACLKELKLPTVYGSYEEQAEKARREHHGYEQYLGELMEGELEARKEKRIGRYLRESRLPLEKNLESFERDKLPGKVDMQVSALLDGSFLDRTENVLAFGNPGSGKSHLLCAIGQELVYQERRIYFRRCDVLVQELLSAKRELELVRVLKHLSKYDAIVIDDIGYVQQSREEMEVLFSLLADRYEKASVMLTSNLAFSEWEKIFKDPMITAAAIDRLVHHSIILELNIPSYRLAVAQRRNKGSSKKAER